MDISGLCKFSAVTNIDDVYPGTWRGAGIQGADLGKLISYDAGFPSSSSHVLVAVFHCPQFHASQSFLVCQHSRRWKGWAHPVLLNSIAHSRSIFTAAPKPHDSLTLIQPHQGERFEARGMSKEITCSSSFLLQIVRYK